MAELRRSAAQIRGVCPPCGKLSTTTSVAAAAVAATLAVAAAATAPAAPATAKPRTAPLGKGGCDCAAALALDGHPARTRAGPIGGQTARAHTVLGIHVCAAIDQMPGHIVLIRNHAEEQWREPPLCWQQTAPSSNAPLKRHAGGQQPGLARAFSPTPPSPGTEGLSEPPGECRPALFVRARASQNPDPRTR